MDHIHGLMKYLHTSNNTGIHYSWKCNGCDSLVTLDLTSIIQFLEQILKWLVDRTLGLMEILTLQVTIRLPSILLGAAMM